MNVTDCHCDGCDDKGMYVTDSHCDGCDDKGNVCDSVIVMIKGCM